MQLLKEVQEAARYCREQNGRPHCKNYGVSWTEFEKAFEMLNNAARAGEELAEAWRNAHDVDGIADCDCICRNRGHKALARYQSQLIV